MSPEEINAVADEAGNAVTCVEFAPIEWAVKPCGESGCVQFIAYGRLDTGVPEVDASQGAVLHLSRASAAELARALVGGAS